MMVLVAFGLSAPDGRIEVNARGEARTELQVSKRLEAYYSETKELLHSIFRRNGCRVVEVDFVDHQGRPFEQFHLSTAHQLGSCRMADTPAQGVCNADGEVFGYPGLFITDGSAIPSSLAVNPALTILANAERISERLLQRSSADPVIAHVRAN
jgi:cholesterol oxidase